MAIRTYGDPVLKRVTEEITDIDGSLVDLVNAMVETMYEAPGVGLAANQVGISKRLFVYDIGHGPEAVVNPQIIESDGSWTYEEGCLSIPGVSFTITRPNAVHLVGRDLNGSEISLEVDEFEGRVFQHELDHLDGVLMVERLDDDERGRAKRLLAERLTLPSEDPDGLGQLLIQL
ncbi:MAG: peptide deformylase [Actinobacteria bacterium]|nr:peptide deformylase [Actinomycetota bacterium]